MSYTNHVLWSEGLFIKPQHFQQQARAFDDLLQRFRASISHYLYGFESLEINSELLTFGQLALSQAKGIFSDGTVFDLPEQVLPPEPMMLSDNHCAGKTVYLGVPLKTPQLVEVDRDGDCQGRRYQLYRTEITDVHSELSEPSTLELTRLQLKLLLGEEQLAGYSYLPLCKIKERRADGSIVLDNLFFPCHLNIAAVPEIKQWLNELSLMINQRAKGLAEKLNASSRSQHGNVADLSDFMLLQALNRVGPAMTHLASLPILHPERAYYELVSICGELSTFTEAEQLAPHFLPYVHANPAQAFHMVIQSLRQSLTVVLQPRAQSLTVEKRRYGLLVAAIPDSALIHQADFILAIRAEMPQKQLLDYFIQQSKIASVEKIRELISLQLPGISLIHLPAPPGQLPYQAGYLYFQLDQRHRDWSMMHDAAGFAFHVAGEIKGLEVQLWAIYREGC